MENTVNDRVLKVRSALGLTQAQFAARIGKTQASVWKIETGESAPRRTTLEMICKEFNVNADWLMTGEGADVFLDDPQPAGADLSWKQEAYNAVKDENVFLKEEIKWLRTLVSKMAGTPDFRRAIDIAGALSPINGVRGLA